MITEEQKILIVQEIGPKQNKKLCDYGRKKDVRRPNGEFYSVHTYEKVLNGVLDLPKIEDVILDCYQYYKRKRERREKRKEKILMQN